MTDKKSPNYRKPPVEHQFKKGLSGNPRGRPPKRARAPVPSQIVEDVLTDAQRLVTIKVRGKEQRVTTIEAILWTIRNKALAGHMPAARFYSSMWREAVDEFYRKNGKYLSNVEKLRAEVYDIQRHGQSGATTDLYRGIMKKIRKATGGE